jgi:hypothetical protein
MPISTWIRDAFGIGKDLVDLKKSKLEIDELEHKKQVRLITLVGFDDLEKYDPKLRRLIEEIRLNNRTGFAWDSPELIASLQDLERLFVRRRRQTIALLILFSLGLVALGVLIGRGYSW